MAIIVGVTVSTVGAIGAAAMATGWMVGATGVRSKIELAMPTAPPMRVASDDNLATGSIRRVASVQPPDYRNYARRLTLGTGISYETDSSTSIEKSRPARVQLASLEPVNVTATLAERFGELAPDQPSVPAIPVKRGNAREEPVALAPKRDDDRVPLPQARPKLAYARPDFDVAPATPSAPAQPPEPARSATDLKTAVYDIEAHVVFLPSGRKLEAHSGLGEWMDDPASKRTRMRGVTPPNVYNLTLRESLFHGVQAIRLNPIDEDKMFGRDGILAHSYMLGPNGASNGCVSFRDYPAFLRAFRDGEVNRMMVLERGGAIRAAELHGRSVTKYAFDDSSPEPAYEGRRSSRRTEARSADAASTPRPDVW